MRFLQFFYTCSKLYLPCAVWSYFKIFCRRTTLYLHTFSKPIFYNKNLTYIVKNTSSKISYFDIIALSSYFSPLHFHYGNSTRGKGGGGKGVFLLLWWPFIVPDIHNGPQASTSQSIKLGLMRFKGWVHPKVDILSASILEKF